MYVVRPDFLIYKINFIRELVVLSRMNADVKSSKKSSIHNRNFALLLLHIKKVKICIWLTLVTVRMKALNAS